MAEHGPRKMNMALAARIAETDRQLLYRNRPDRQVLIHEATERELQRVLFVAGDLVSEQEGVCRVAEQIVRAARTVREHPPQVVARHPRLTKRCDQDVAAFPDARTHIHSGQVCCSQACYNLVAHRTTYGSEA
ncbi:hypothetical protein [Streptomyces sp. NPDC093149]|uniref:hypothetical protein n=1 Tax=Streptomyces sp. NPDC093149 TaxID=3366031 RepID=UPI00381A03D1